MVDVLLQRLASLALVKAESEVRLVLGAKEDVENLTSNLEAIQAVLEDAEQRQVTEVSVRRWLDKLNQVSFKMDDVLDEWITQVQRHQWEKQERQNLSTTKKVHASASSFFTASKVTRLIQRRQVAARIKELNIKIALIAKEKQDFSFQNITRGHVLPGRPKTTSFLGETFGRDEEKNVILSKLLVESSGGKGVPIIILIVGLGGMGKTTLAQLVYNDVRVKEHFDCRIWLCVSDSFNMITIARAIVESLDENSPSLKSEELQTLVQCISRLMAYKKFLLVLDDVWYPNNNEWGELVKAFSECSPGSRILVTTRNMEVSTIMKATTDHIVHMTKLSEAYCYLLFHYNAGLNDSVCKRFHTLGKLIVEKCNGLPLAAKTLGCHMLGKTTTKQWQDVLEKKMWEIKEIEQDVFQPLLLSYHDLSPAVKRCLLYCVVFPKDYELERDNLIELWSSQNYLNAKENNTVQQGQQYFDNLVTRSFFQECEVKGNGSIKCKMHDIVHDLLQYLTKNECKIIDFKLGVDVEALEELNEKILHLALVHLPDTKFTNSLLKCKNLRTFVAMDSSISSNGLESIVQLKCLRTLSLCNTGIQKISKEISGLIHLRHLDLSSNKDLIELPVTMSSSLYNMQTLRLDGCRSLEKVDLRGMINLRHLLVEGCSILKLMGIETLINLHTLDVFYVHHRDGGNKVEDLKDLNQLQGSLTIWSIHMNLREKAIMLNKARLLHLDIYFLDFDSKRDRELLDALQPNPGLESLRIGYYQGTTLTTDWWSSLSNLRRLTISRCKNCEFWPPLGKLASLESLKIQYFEHVTKVGVEFLGIDAPEMQTSTYVSFPKLKQLTFDYLESWESWEGVEEDHNITTRRIMPCLSSLTIIDCPWLEKLPDFLWKAPLQTVNFNHSLRLQAKYGQKLQEMKMDKEMNGKEFIFHTHLDK